MFVLLFVFVFVSIFVFAGTAGPPTSVYPARKAAQLDQSDGCKGFKYFAIQVTICLCFCHCLCICQCHHSNVSKAKKILHNLQVRWNSLNSGHNVKVRLNQSVNYLPYWLSNFKLIINWTMTHINFKMYSSNCKFKFSRLKKLLQQAQIDKCIGQNSIIIIREEYKNLRTNHVLYHSGLLKKDLVSLFLDRILHSYYSLFSASPVYILMIFHLFSKYSTSWKYSSLSPLCLVVKIQSSSSS